VGGSESVLVRFRHLPVREQEDNSQNWEQLQAALTALGKVSEPAETTKANTEAIKAMLKILREA
jgi:hypothetical protein